MRACLFIIRNSDNILGHANYILRKTDPPIGQNYVRQEKKVATHLAQLEQKIKK